MAPPPPPSNPSKLRLYEAYVKTNNSSGEISAAPVLYSEIKKEDKNADLKLAPQPIRNSYVKKAKPKVFTKPPAVWNKTVDTNATTSTAGQRKTYEDWASEKVDTSAYLESQEAMKRQRKEKKKKKTDEVLEQDIDWAGESYDLERPTIYGQYRPSENYFRMDRTWLIHVRTRGGCPNPENDEEDALTPVTQSAPTPVTKSAPTPVTYSAPTPVTQSAPTPVTQNVPTLWLLTVPANAPSPNTAVAGQMGPPAQSLGTGGMARPVNTQTKRKWAEAMLAKSGWEKGKGLGANEDGIVEPIVQQLNKAGPHRGMGKIVGGTYAEGTEGSKSWSSSRVLVLHGLLNGVDLEADNERADGGIRQQMGDAIGRFGTIERIKLYQDTKGDENSVFIKFTEPHSAVNALGHFQRGAKFEDKPVRAKLFSEDDFEKDIYE